MRAPRHRYSVILPRPYTCPKSQVVVTAASGHSADRRLAEFLSKRSHQRALHRIVLRALRAHRRERLDDGRVRAKVVERIRKKFLALYKARTGRNAFSLYVYLRWRPPPSK